MKIPRPWLTAAAISSVITLVAKELALELVFGSAADWLKSNLWILGDFLAWRWSGLVLGLILFVTVWCLGLAVEQRRSTPTGGAPAAAGGPTAQPETPQGAASGAAEGATREIRTKEYVEVTPEDGRMISNGVLWEWDTYFDRGKGGMDGPLCPYDAVRLKYQRATQPSPVVAPSSLSGLLGEKREPTPLAKPAPPVTPLHTPFSLPASELRPPMDQDRVGGAGGGELYCIKCRSSYVFTGSGFADLAMGKAIGAARSDAGLLFEAKARNQRAREN